MNKHIIISSFFSVLTLIFTNSLFALEKYDEGIDYKKIGINHKFKKTKKIEVTEFFWFGCPHCKSFYPYLKKWAENKPKYVKYIKYHVPFREINHQRLYFTLKEMKIQDELTPIIFNIIQGNIQPLNDLLSILDWLESQNVDTEKFEEIWNSKKVKNSMKKATNLMKTFKISGVPQVVIDGTYLTSPAMVGGSHKRTLKVIDYLIEKRNKN
jgi:thiol:disulfide interchange protein DsbA